jgi:hypothetical protein
LSIARPSLRRLLVWTGSSATNRGASRSIHKEDLMQTSNVATTGSSTPRLIRTGRVLSGLAMLFLGFDAAMKVARAAPAVAATIGLGYDARLVATIGLLELVCLVAYALPPTSVVGAVLLTGYLGGAVATHLRAGSPVASQTLFPVYVALFVWGGLVLRDARLRELLPRRAR